MPQGYSKVPALTGGQSGLLEQLISMLSGTGAQGFEQGLQSLMGMLSGSDESFEAFEAPLKRQFQEEVIPQLTERLTGLGAGGGRSSGAGQILGQAGQRFEEGLAGQRAQLQQNAIQQLLSTFLGGSQQALGTKAFGFAQKPQGGFGSQFGGILGKLAGNPGIFNMFNRSAQGGGGGY